MLKLTLLGLSILVINNILLLNMLGYFSNQPESSLISSRDLSATKSEQGPGKADEQKQICSSKRTMPTGNNSAAVNKSDAVQDEEFLQAFARVAKHPEFIRIIDDYQLQNARRREQVRRHLQTMSAHQLYDIALNSDLRLEKQLAISNLIGGKLKQLDAELLQNLYLDPTFEVHGKSQIIDALLAKDDLQGVEWAKQRLLDKEFNGYFLDDTLAHIYRHDPHFIKQMVENIDFNDSDIAGALTSFVTSQPNLAADFVYKHFEEIIVSDHAYAISKLEGDSNLKLSDKQQKILLELIDSKASRTRYSVISLVGLIEDVRQLRDVFGELKNQREREYFVTTLLSNGDNSEHVNLARELAVDMDDPTVKMMLMTIDQAAENR